MPKFYATYPSRIARLARRYSVVEADSFDEAHQKVFNIRGPAWAFLYTEEQFIGEVNHLGIKYPSQPEAYGLTEIPLDNNIFE